ncbi:MAG TPA: LysM peptidoglycan-binding domain-containing protein [Chlamydiales bacterium]|nr:LysM peptidoglycan-binding domain-containing protein [Chlamydiales bacterium]
MTLFFAFGVISALLVGCSPLKTSPHDEKYQWELTLHEVQTNLDDLRHDTNCFATEIQILDGRIKCFENALASLKQQDIEKQQTRIDQIAHQLQLIDRKWTAFEKKQETAKENVESLSTHAKETGIALSQFKNRMMELETEILQQGRKLDTIAKLKDGLIKSTKVYKVRPGDSLEKIAKTHKTDVSTLKLINHLQNDLIVVDQELNVP